jgi:hypothetical protein
LNLTLRPTRYRPFARRSPAPKAEPSQECLATGKAARRALLAAGGNEEEFALSVWATRNTGASAEDLKEVLLHVAIYAGVPAANRAFRAAKRVLSELERER